MAYHALTRMLQGCHGLEVTRAPWLLCLLFLGCPGPSRPDAGPAKCDAVAADTCANPMTRFSDVQPILQARCASCHTGARDAPWPFNTYENFTDWSDLVSADLVTCSMPPADAGVMPAAERALILDWLRCGFPQ